MRMECPYLAKIVEPGQFINIKVNNEFIPLLRKPFSVCRRNIDEGWIEVLWKIVGKGTEIMAGYRAGDVVNVLGPLGRGFYMPPDMHYALLVGGGLGVAPLLFLCEEILKAGKSVLVFLGAKSVDELTFIDVFLQMDVEVYFATEDGSKGKSGLVTDLIIEYLKQEKDLNRRHIFSCGPVGLLNKMIKISDEFNLEGQISIETMMGCGFGICMGCPVRVRGEQTGGGLFKLACVDGPVFNAREVWLDG
ncbi:MAG: dihydroorotate dehydrogenase electron transfer subunit [bacterium]